MADEFIRDAQEAGWEIFRFDAAFGQTISAIAKLAPNSVIKKGLEVTYSSYNRAEIGAWLDNLSQ